MKPNIRTGRTKAKNKFIDENGIPEEFEIGPYNPSFSPMNYEIRITINP